MIPCVESKRMTIQIEHGSTRSRPYIYFKFGCVIMYHHYCIISPGAITKINYSSIVSDPIEINPSTKSKTTRKRHAWWYIHVAIAYLRTWVWYANFIAYQLNQTSSPTRHNNTTKNNNSLLFYHLCFVAYVVSLMFQLVFVSFNVFDLIWN